MEAAAEARPLRSASRRALAALWLLGLFNNSLFVVLNAGATSISSGSVGLVYLFNTLPTLLVQGAGPYAFHLVSHAARVRLCCLLFTASICTVASSRSMWLQLVGVGLGSLAQGLGESSMLGLCSHYGERGVTAWSSGTGFAGIFGYAWKALWVDALGFSFSATLMLSLVLPAGFVGAFEGLLDKPPALRTSAAMSDRVPLLPAAVASEPGAQNSSAGTGADADVDVDAGEDVGEEIGSPLSTSERIHVFASLWPFTVPLFVVYVSEYAMQSGAWASIGFPVKSKQARDRFYLWSNWLYQVGVFICTCAQEGRPLQRDGLVTNPASSQIIGLPDPYEPARALGHAVGAGAPSRLLRLGRHIPRVVVQLALAAMPTRRPTRRQRVRSVVLHYESPWLARAASAPRVRHGGRIGGRDGGLRSRRGARHHHPGLPIRGAGHFGQACLHVRVQLLRLCSTAALVDRPRRRPQR